MLRTLVNKDIWTIVNKYSYPDTTVTKTYATYVDGKAALLAKHYGLVLQSPYLKFRNFNKAIETDRIDILQRLVDLGVQRCVKDKCMFLSDSASHFFVTTETLQFISDNLCTCDKTSHPLKILCNAVQHRNLDVIKQYDSIPVIENDICHHITNGSSKLASLPMLSWMWDHIDRNDDETVGTFMSACILRAGMYEEPGLLEWIKENVDSPRIIENSLLFSNRIKKITSIPVLDYLWSTKMYFKHEPKKTINGHIVKDRLDVLNWYVEKFPDMKIEPSLRIIASKLVQEDDSTFRWLCEKCPTRIKKIFTAKLDSESHYLLYKQMIQTKEIQRRTKDIFTEEEYEEFKDTVCETNLVDRLNVCFNRNDFDLIRYMIEYFSEDDPNNYFLVSLIKCGLGSSTTDCKAAFTTFRYAYHMCRNRPAKLFTPEKLDFTTSRHWYAPDNTQNMISLIKWVYNMEGFVIVEYNKVAQSDNLELVIWLHDQNIPIRVSEYYLDPEPLTYPDIFLRANSGPKIFQWAYQQQEYEELNRLKLCRMDNYEKNKIAIIINNIKHDRYVSFHGSVVNTSVYHLLKMVSNHIDLDLILADIGRLPE